MADPIDIVVAGGGMVGLGDLPGDVATRLKSHMADMILKPFHARLPWLKDRMRLL